MTYTERSLRPIKTESDYENALERINSLMNALPDTPEADELDILGILVAAYEEEHYPIDFPSPIAAICFRLEQLGWNEQDLIPYMGSVAEVQAVLLGQSALTLSVIRTLHKHLGIPADVLLQEPKASYSANNAQLN